MWWFHDCIHRVKTLTEVLSFPVALRFWSWDLHNRPLLCENIMQPIHGNKISVHIDISRNGAINDFVSIKLLSEVSLYCLFKKSKKKNTSELLSKSGEVVITKVLSDTHSFCAKWYSLSIPQKHSLGKSSLVLILVVCCRRCRVHPPFALQCFGRWNSRIFVRPPHGHIARSEISFGKKPAVILPVYLPCLLFTLSVSIVFCPLWFTAEGSSVHRWGIFLCFSRILYFFSIRV